MSAYTLSFVRYPRPVVSMLRTVHFFQYMKIEIEEDEREISMWGQVADYNGHETL